MGKVLVLLYHRVNSISDDVYHLTVSPENFEKHISYLNNNFRIFRFEDDWEKYDEDGVVITFDDGYMDNYKYALPILETYHVPAAIFVSSGYVNTHNEYWWDEISRLLTCGKNYPAQFELKDTLYHYVWNTKTQKERIDLMKSLHWLLKLEPEVERANYWISQLRNWAGMDAEGRAENLPMNLEQLKRVDASEVITIGGHTVNHRSLGCQSRRAQQYEIATSVVYLEKILKHKIEVFSYPFGSKVHYNEDTFEICGKCGIKKAATTNKGIWNAEVHSLQIPRMEVKDYDYEQFKKFIEECWKG